MLNERVNQVMDELNVPEEIRVRWYYEVINWVKDRYDYSALTEPEMFTKYAYQYADTYGDPCKDEVLSAANIIREGCRRDKVARCIVGWLLERSEVSPPVALCESYKQVFARDIPLSSNVEVPWSELAKRLGVNTAHGNNPRGVEYVYGLLQLGDALEREGMRLTDASVIEGIAERLPPAIQKRVELGWDYTSLIVEYGDEAFDAYMEQRKSHNLDFWLSIDVNKRFNLITQIVHSVFGCVVYTPDDPNHQWSDTLSYEGYTMELANTLVDHTKRQPVIPDVIPSLIETARKLDEIVHGKE